MMKQPLLAAVKEDRSKSKNSKAKASASSSNLTSSGLPLSNHSSSKKHGPRLQVNTDARAQYSNLSGLSSARKSNSNLSSTYPYKSDLGSTGKSPRNKLTSDEGLLELKRKVKESDAITDEFGYRKLPTRPRGTGNLDLSRNAGATSSSISPPPAGPKRENSPGRSAKASPEPQRQQIKANIERSPRGSSPGRRGVLERSESPKSIERRPNLPSGTIVKPLEFGITPSVKELLIRETRFVDKKDVDRALGVEPATEIFHISAQVQQRSPKSYNPVPQNQTPAKKSPQKARPAPIRVADPPKQAPHNRKPTTPTSPSASPVSRTSQPTNSEAPLAHSSVILASKRAMSPKKAVEMLGFNHRLPTRQNAEIQRQIAESLKLSEAAVKERTPKSGAKSIAQLVPIKTDNQKQFHSTHKSEAKLVKSSIASESVKKLKQQTDKSENGNSKSPSKPKIEKIDVSPKKAK